MPFDDRPPRVPEDNPTGVYRRAFAVPRRLARPPRRAALRRRARARCTCSSTGSRSGSRRTRARRPSSTSRSSCATTAPNELVAVVVRWSDASFVEDQDQWWHAGLRASCCSTRRRATHVADVFARGDMARAPRRSRCGRSAPASVARCSIGPDGERVLDEPLARRPARARRRAAPRLWSAEEPALYTLELVTAGERRRSACRVGFRSVEVARPAAARQRPRRADLRRQPPRPRRPAAAGP